MNSKLSSAKAAIVLDQYFFGHLVCNLKFREDTACKTAWTDGTTLGYNPAYIDSLQHAEIVGLLAHEVLHCAGGHPWRRDGRDPKRWNVACDIAINDIIREAGMTLPKGSLEGSSIADSKGKSAEWIYDRLPDDPQGGSGKGKGKGGQDEGEGLPGEVRDPEAEGQGDGTEQADSDKMSEGEWQEITRQAANAAKARGQLPASLDRYAKKATESRIPWESVLRRFVQEHSKADYSWNKPSRRYAAMGVYLPGLHSEELGKGAIAVDTSGSMDDIALAKAESETIKVMQECRPRTLAVLYADAAVARIDTFEKDEPIVFKPAGFGGTDFRPVFEAIEAMDEKPLFVIYITDLCGTFPDVEPDVPVLWVTDGDLKAPFGETIKM